MAKILDMPKLSPTMEEGVLATWHKKEGDAIGVDDLCAHAAVRPALVHDDRAMRTPYALGDGVLVERSKTAKVHDLRGDARFLEVRGCVHRDVRGARLRELTRHLRVRCTRD